MPSGAKKKKNRKKPVQRAERPAWGTNGKVGRGTFPKGTDQCGGNQKEKGRDPFKKAGLPREISILRTDHARGP